VHADIRSIISQPEYSEQEPDVSALERVGKWINTRLSNFGKAINKLLRGREMPDAKPMPRWLAFCILAVLAAGMAALLVYGIRKISFGAINAKKRKPTVAEHLDPAEAATSDPNEWLEAARRYAVAGDFRKAYRAVFISILVSLDRRGFVHYDKSRTNGEYIRSLRGKSEAFDYFRPLARDFDARWYGHTTIYETDYATLLEAHERVPNNEQLPSN